MPNNFKGLALVRKPAKNFQMYNPSRFQETDMEEAFRFMELYPFATVITVVNGEPSISHLPVTPQKAGSEIELIGQQFYIPEDLTGKALSKAIVGFRIKIENINFKKKLSQNRTPADRMGVMKGLSEGPDDNSRGILAAMAEIFDPSGKSK